MTAKRYRKRPVEVEAMQLTEVNRNDVLMWMREHRSVGVTGVYPSSIAISTLEGEMRANPGDWIIRGVQGEFYPCRADIFDQTYEAVDGWDLCPTCAGPIRIGTNHVSDGRGGCSVQRWANPSDNPCTNCGVSKEPGRYHVFRSPGACEIHSRWGTKV